MAEVVALLGRGGQRFAETDAIFERVHAINADTDKNPHKLRMSLDCRAVIKIGPFSRGGKNRIEQNASGHDFQAENKLVPFGIFLPELGESHFWFSSISKKSSPDEKANDAN